MDTSVKQTVLIVGLVVLLGGCQSPAWLRDLMGSKRGPSAVDDNKKLEPIRKFSNEAEIIDPIPNPNLIETARRPADDSMVHTEIRFGEDRDPCVSPDGNWFVFSSTRHSKTSDIYMQSAKGKVAMKLTSHPGSDLQPSFSPDGRKIAFTSNRENGVYHIWVLHIKDAFAFPKPGENPVKVKAKPVKKTNGRANHVHPTWSPDSTRLAYSRYNDQSGRWEVWVMDLTTEQEYILTEGLLPVWSPVGDQIAFQRFKDRDSRWANIWTINAITGTNLTEVVPANDYPVTSPGWSPDGQYLVYSSCALRAVGNRQIWIPDDIWMISVTGRHETALTTNEHSDSSPSWRGKRLFYSSNKNGFQNIWSIAPYLVPNSPGEILVDSK